MLKLSRLVLIIFLLTGCMNSRENVAKVLLPHINQYLNHYISDNEDLNKENHAIILHCETINRNEYALNIRNEMKDNVHNFIEEKKDSLFIGLFKGFKIFIKDDKRISFKDKSIKGLSLRDLSVDENIPVSYDGACWEFKIKDGKIINFSYQFCTPKREVIKQLKSINIPNK